LKPSGVVFVESSPDMKTFAQALQESTYLEVANLPLALGGGRTAGRALSATLGGLTKGSGIRAGRSLRKKLSLTKGSGILAGRRMRARFSSSVR
jgi:hypothetical protein